MTERKKNSLHFPGLFIKKKKYFPRCREAHAAFQKCKQNIQMRIVLLLSFFFPLSFRLIIFKEFPRQNDW